MTKRKPKKRNSVSITHPANLELDALIGKVRSQAHDVNLIANDVVGNTQSVMDQADKLRPLLPYIPSQVTEGLLDIWGSASSQLSQVHFVFSQAQPSTSSASGTITLSTTSIMRAYTNDQLMVEGEGFQAAWKPYVRFGVRSTERDALIELLKEFGLDVPFKPTEKSALQLIEIAHKAFEAPVTPDNPVESSLPSLRGSLTATITMLLQMRPIQEEAKGWENQILSICAQLKKDTLPEIVIQDLADQCFSLWKDLSGLKIADIGRDEWLVWLSRGTSFLTSLLKGLDSTKLARRKPPS